MISKSQIIPIGEEMWAAIKEVNKRVCNQASGCMFMCMLLKILKTESVF